ncbi:MAG: TIGR03545 family protein, partial [Bacteroidota bacterium]
MRKKFVFFVLVPLLALCIVLYLFAERWIESGLEEAGEGIVGAKVEIDNLRLSISPVAIEFSRLQVTNPKDTWKNIFKTGRVRFALNIGQLIRNKYIVETMEVNNLIFGTKRATDGSLPKPRSLSGESSSIIIEATAALTREAKKAPVFDLEKLRKGLKIDSLLSVQSLRTIRHLDSLKLQVQEASQQWRATLADIEKSKQRAAEIEANIKAINLNELRTIESIAGAINKVSAAYKDINELNETFKNRRAAITDQINRLYSSVAMVDDLARADYEMVKGFARLPDLSTQGMANLLLGKEILHKVNNYLSWVDFARTTVPKYLPEPEYEKPKRFQGQDIHFPVERAYPKW